MTGSYRLKLGDILVQTGIISSEQQREALALHRQTGERLGMVLVKKGYLSEQRLIEVLEFQLGIPHVVLAKRQIAPETLALVPESVARKYRIFPVEKLGDRLVLGMLEPTDILAIDDLRLSLKMEIQPVIITEEDLEQAFARYFGIAESVQDVIKEIDIEIEEARGEEPSVAVLESLVEEAPIVRLVNLVITQAVKERASDIHLEPTERELMIRYRVDGRLRRLMTTPKNTQAAIISRVKIIAGMNIAEKRLPQDGRIQMRVDGVAVDLRVSAIPTLFGEKMVLRILFKNNALTNVDKLGFSPEILEKFRAAYHHPYGIVLVTGPTGSGKSTTLSAVLNELNHPETNIMTVEDPVEYQIPGVNQVQVNTKAGLTFAAALRAFLRQDPDIIMVGEIRDRETAQIATQAALTGHLVLSTLHTNDAASSITRLLDMDIEAFLVASTVIGVLAQRLARRICEGCKQAYRITPEDPCYRTVRSHLPELAEERLVFYQGKGCRQCNGTGYAKRLALQEVLVVDGKLRGLIGQNGTAAQLKEAAAAAGMRTLFKDGLSKALAGQTSLEEIIRVAYAPD